MNDPDCTAFLQWALPQINLRWPGFRKVRRQVCKRIKRRMHDLQLGDFPAYRARLEDDPSEWEAVDRCCYITISRFFRDKGVFEALQRRALPDIAARAKQEERAAQIWSAGCAAGEEPYTLRLLWDSEIARLCPDIPLAIVATDIDETMLARAREGCFAATSLRELPSHFISEAFDRVGPSYCVKSRHREGIIFLHQDIRSETPGSLFDIVLCRYLAFTYFAPALQEQVLARIVDQLGPNGYLVIGTHERLPGHHAALIPLDGAPQIFQRRAAPSG